MTYTCSTTDTYPPPYYEPAPCAAGDCINKSLVNPCLNSIADQVLNPELLSQYNQLIQDVFNRSENVNLTLVEGIAMDEHGNHGYGMTGSAMFSGPIANVTVTLDTVALLGKSAEFIGATIYHECFHAIVNYLTENRVSGDNQHMAMFSNYLGLLASGLEQAFPQLASFPGDASSLILIGLLAKEDGPQPRPGRWSTAFVNSLLSETGFTRDQINIVMAKYEIYKTSGTRCN